MRLSPFLRCGLVSAAWLFSTTMAMAAMCTPSPGGSTCGGAGVASQGNSSGTDQGAGNPINLINGNKYQMEVDMPALPGVLGLEVVRHYNSQYSLPNVPSGVLGRGWKLSYETELYDNAVGLQIVQADGTRLIFQKNPRDTSHCTSSDPANGVVSILDKPQGKEYIWRWPGNGKTGGRTLWFDRDGKLVQIAAPTGEFVTLQYSPKGWLLQVRDPQNRVLNLNYLDAKTAQTDKDGTQRFRGVQSIDSPLGRFAYQYGNPLPQGSTHAPTLTVANLTGVVNMRNNITRSYHYEDPKFPTLLTGISVQGRGSDGVPMHQRISTYGYDNLGKAVRSEKADGSEKVSLDTNTPGQTVLTNALGQTTTYRHAQIAGQWRLLESRGAGCAQCGSANMRYGYDKLGRLTEQTSLNAQGQALLTWRTKRDAQGRPIQTERVGYTRAIRGQVPSAGAAKWVVRYAYSNDTATEPSMVAWPSVVLGKEHRIHTLYNEAGQPTQVTESGYEPVQGQAIERTTRYSYQTINGNTVLASVDGPLSNGPLNSPQDSDITQLTWDKNGNTIVAVTLPGGNVHSVQYEPSTGLLSEVKNASGDYTQFVYDTQARLTTLRSGGLGWQQPRAQSYRYDALGRATQMGTGEDGDGTFKPQALQGFDATGRVLWHANALGMLLQNQYDAEGRLLQTGRYSRSIAQEVHASYDAQGALHRLQDNAGRAWSRALPVADALKSRLSTEALEQRRAATLPPVQRWVDDFGREVRTLSADHGSSLRRYDEADRLIGMTDALGHVASYQYTLQGRIAKQSVTDATTGKVQHTHWHYNAQGKLSEVIHPVQSERYEYDARGLPTARIVSLGTSEGEYQAITRYHHDASGQLTASTLPDGSLLQYHPNGQKQVTHVVRNPIRTPWLRWLGHEQTIVKDLTRDVVGLRSYTSGNGIQALYQRSAQGDLARIVYRHPVGPTQLQAALNSPVGLTTQESINWLLGVRHAKAADSPSADHKAAHNASASNEAKTPAASDQPGALGLPIDPRALLDHRYLWDARGNLLHTQSNGPVATITHAHHAPNTVVRRSSYAYDAQARLLAASTGLASVQSVAGAWEAVAPEQNSHSRFAYDFAGRRVLSQQNIQDSGELTVGTQTHTYQAKTHRLMTDQARYSPNGQPLQMAGHRLMWDALGRLTRVTQMQDLPTDPSVAYDYDHRGLRIAKHVYTRVGAPTQSATYYLYDTDRQPLAELNAQGRITRQYLYVAHLPLAVVDTPDGQARAVAQAGVSEQAWMALQDVGMALQSWVYATSGMGQLVWLHTNHLGAPEAATNDQAQLVWQARYEAFGAARVNEGRAMNASPATKRGFVLHLRLPGQYFDEETGLHYNRQRYYDPQAGQYLTPDPLGHPDGPNPYAYVRHNPLGFVDPDGLVLFAFDGTGNSRDTNDPAMKGASPTNVAEFLQLYRDTGQEKRYVSGVGTVHKDDKYGDIVPDDFAKGKLLDYLSGSDPLWVNDMGGNYSGPARIDRMVLYMRDESIDFDDTKAMDIDIVGFSRGAAEARDFANQIVQNSQTVDGKSYYRYLNNKTNKFECQWVNFRFMGLWDTVLSTNFSGRSYALGIPAQFAYVAQAVALNEHRSGNILSYGQRSPLPYLQHWGGFPLESIGANSNTAGATRIELGFLGTHADIGGGYADNALSKVALAWMIEQATNAGVKMDEAPIAIQASVVLHDKSNNIQTGQPQDTCALCTDGEDRQVNGAVSGDKQRNMGFGKDSNSMTYADTQNPENKFITYQDRNTLARYTEEDISKEVSSSLVGRIKTDVTGTVNVDAYVAWLKLNGYALSKLKVE